MSVEICENTLWSMHQNIQFHIEKTKKLHTVGGGDGGRGDHTLPPPPSSSVASLPRRRFSGNLECSLWHLCQIKFCSTLGACLVFRINMTSQTCLRRRSLAWPCFHFCENPALCTSMLRLASVKLHGSVLRNTFVRDWSVQSLSSAYETSVTTNVIDERVWQRRFVCCLKTPSLLSSEIILTF